MKTLEQLVEGHFGHFLHNTLGKDRKAIIIFADGIAQEFSALDETQELQCGFFQESQELDRQSGYNVVTDKPVAIFRVKDLIRLPKPAEKVFVKVRLSVDSDEMTTYQVGGPPKSAKTIGFINFQLQSVSQI